MRQPLALPLMWWLAPAMLLDAWNASMASVMRAHLRARDTLVVMLVMHATHLGLAVPLMWGVGTWPGLGLPGFALALLVARSLALALHLWLWRHRLGLFPAASDWWRPVSYTHLDVYKRQDERNQCADEGPYKIADRDPHDPE